MSLHIYACIICAYGIRILCTIYILQTIAHTYHRIYDVYQWKHTSSLRTLISTFRNLLSRGVRRSGTRDPENFSGKLCRFRLQHRNVVYTIYYMHIHINSNVRSAEVSSSKRANSIYYCSSTIGVCTLYYIQYLILYHILFSLQ